MAEKETRDQNNIYFIHMNSEGTQEGGKIWGRMERKL